MPIPVLRVSQLNRFVRSLLESAPQLSEVYLRGEISNLSYYPASGHYYFSLKDEAASVRAVMFRSNAALLRFIPENGMCVLARGAVTLYERDGLYQLTVSELVPDGAGARAVMLEQLRRRLTEEGLFSQEKKRPLPKNPGVIGIVTSPQGAVLHDILSVVERKAPDLRLLLAPAAVQGREAAASVARAIRLLGEDGRSDVILLARGGGSAEDLWAFQEEESVRAVASSPIPVISAVGHETDTTLCDWAADCRAATPTAAAEIALGGREDLRVRLSQKGEALSASIRCRLTENDRLFSERKSKISSLDPAFLLAEQEKRLYNITEKMHNLRGDLLRRQEEKILTRAGQLDLLSPLRVLARGYSITQKNGVPLQNVSQLLAGDTVETRLAEGRLLSVVTEVIQDDI